MQNNKTILIIGVNGFIGHHLTKRILETTDWNISGMDIDDSRVKDYLDNPRFKFRKEDMSKCHDYIEQELKNADTFLPLAAVATPNVYVQNPLKVFELDFESNLPLVRMCAKLNKRLIWPSTSEVYGMCPDEEFNPDTSKLVTGPIRKHRWIYSTSKQLMDRVIWAMGEGTDFDFTLFRPFNWTGTGLDNIHNKGVGASRVITQFMGQILRGEDIVLVDDGIARRSFTFVDDCIDALIKIIENNENKANRKIYNIGNPRNNFSIAQLAEMLIREAPNHKYFKDKLDQVKIISKSAMEVYGPGYEDMGNRVPYIKNTQEDLNWDPKVTLEDAVKTIFRNYVEILDKENAK